MNLSIEPLKPSKKDLNILKMLDIIIVKFNITFHIIRIMELEFLSLIRSLFIKMFLFLLKSLKPVTKKMLLLIPGILMFKLQEIPLALRVVVLNKEYVSTVTWHHILIELEEGNWIWLNFSIDNCLKNTFNLFF